MSDLSEIMNEIGRGSPDRKVVMKINEKTLEKSLLSAAEPAIKKAEKEANRAAAKESSLDGKVNAFAKALKRNNVEPDKKAIRKAFKDQGVD